MIHFRPKGSQWLPSRWWEGELTNEAERVACALARRDPNDQGATRAALPLAWALRLAAWPWRVGSALLHWLRFGYLDLFKLFP